MKLLAGLLPTLAHTRVRAGPASWCRHIYKLGVGSVEPVPLELNSFARKLPTFTNSNPMEILTYSSDFLLGLYSPRLLLIRSAFN